MLVSLYRCSFLVGKVAWAMTECLATESADYCMLTSERAWLSSRVCLIWLEVDFGSVLELEFGQKWTLKGMNKLKVVSSKRKVVFDSMLMNVKVLSTQIWSVTVRA